MKILYVANFQAGKNDDEGAIKHAFEVLGHEVVAVQEGGEMLPSTGVDLLLFHKGRLGPEALSSWRGKCPIVFWYFDQVESPVTDERTEGQLIRRTVNRRNWMEDVIPRVDYGFCSDGDWVCQDKTGKLRWLPQGADERVVGREDLGEPEKEIDLLFTGCSALGGPRRQSFIDLLSKRYGGRFRHVEEGVYGMDLRRLIGRSRLVVCPDYPTTQRYWSNRVWVAAGFGAVLLHPSCEWLDHYGCMVTYESRDQLVKLADHYLSRDLTLSRMQLSEAALQWTRRSHLYRHRCEKLLTTVFGRKTCGS